jgi:formylglycine-generating enzyme required for sulfatase activity
VTFEPSDPAVGDALRAAGASPAFLQALTATCGRAARERAAAERAAAERAAAERAAAQRAAAERAAAERAAAERAAAERAAAERAAAERAAAERAAAERAAADRAALEGPHGIRFVRVRAGTFAMGSASGDRDEQPVHRVTLTRDYLLQATEVTQGQWRALMGRNPSYFADCGDNCPVESVSWDDVQTFLQALNRQDPGKGYRLPTEAEWEYAARAGTTGDYGGTGRLDEMGWYLDNSGGRPQPVGRKAPNAWGLYDMHGNVWEWVNDWYGAAYYSAGPPADPLGPRYGSYRVLRGGSWYGSAYRARSANRVTDTPSFRDGSYGFRLARTP